MIDTIVTSTPAYVWLILAALTVLGLSNMRHRTVGVMRLVGPAIGFTIYAVYAAATRFEPVLPALSVWGAGFVIALVLTMRYWRPALATRYHQATGKFELPGSIVPMIIIMVVFLANYALGVMGVIAPGLLANMWLIITMSLLLGACMGFFLGRVVRLLASRDAIAS